MEWELVKLTGKLPHEIGVARRQNPESVRVTEYMIYEDYKRKIERAKKQQLEAKRKSRRHR